MDEGSGTWEPGVEAVRVTTVGSELEADMAVGLLRANEVRAYSQNESSHGISHYGGQAARSSALSLYRIYVHPDDEAEARALLGEGRDAAATTTPGAVTDYETIAAPRKRWTLGVALFVLLFGFLPGGLALAYLIEKFFG